MFSQFSPLFAGMFCIETSHWDSGVTRKKSVGRLSPKTFKKSILSEIDALSLTQIAVISQSQIFKIPVIYFLTWKRDFTGEISSYGKLVSFWGAHFIHFSLGTIVCRENLIILMRLLPGHSHVLCILTSSNSSQWSRMHRLDIYPKIHHPSSTFSHACATDRLLLDS